ncbi:MAG TPA: Asp-tRNA(Asn)/Glu-tRNA(Gln) amidotransferase subunit GatC [Candidatus Angelobacter sp.]|nr:Asp-tRNA(Asn)/Glu-tRNA(Gln) amidotransferase subunit GatC [Candidatus Angelobacter sp.]
MKVTEKDVTYVADLANLELTDQERQRMLKDLNSILDYIDRLNELDTTDVPPMAQISDKFGGAEESGSGKFAGAWRDDVPVPSLSHEQALRNAPVTDGEFFKVPKVIEK